MKVEWKVFPAFYKHFFMSTFPFFHKQRLTPTGIASDVSKIDSSNGPTHSGSIIKAP